jgi:hypothetical protein
MHKALADHRRQGLFAASAGFALHRFSLKRILL